MPSLFNEQRPIQDSASESSLAHFNFCSIKHLIVVNANYDMLSEYNLQVQFTRFQDCHGPISRLIKPMAGVRFESPFSLHALYRLMQLA